MNIDSPQIESENTPVIRETILEEISDDQQESITATSLTLFGTSVFPTINIL